MRFVHNVVRDTGKRLWRYAIGQHEDRPVDESQVRWRGDYGYIGSYRPRSGERRYNLAYRGDGDLRVFYGVGEDGLDDNWAAVIPRRED